MAMSRPMQIVAMWTKKSRQEWAGWWAGWTSSMGAFSFVGFGTCAVCGVSHSWADAIATALAAVTSASGSSFGDSGVSGMQFLVGSVPLDYQRFAGAQGTGRQTSRKCMVRRTTAREKRRVDRQVCANVFGLQVESSLSWP